MQLGYIKYVPKGIINKDGQFDKKILKQLTTEQTKRYKEITKRYLES